MSLEMQNWVVRDRNFKNHRESFIYDESIFLHEPGGNHGRNARVEESNYFLYEDLTPKR